MSMRCAVSRPVWEEIWCLGHHLDHQLCRMNGWYSHQCGCQNSQCRPVRTVHSLLPNSLFLFQMHPHGFTNKNPVEPPGLAHVPHLMMLKVSGLKIGVTAPSDCSPYPAFSDQFGLTQPFLLFSLSLTTLSLHVFVSFSLGQSHRPLPPISRPRHSPKKSALWRFRTTGTKSQPRAWRISCERNA